VSYLISMISSSTAIYVVIVILLLCSYCISVSDLSWTLNTCSLHVVLLIFGALHTYIMTHSTSCSFNALYGCYFWYLCCLLCKIKKTTQVMLIHVVMCSKPSHPHNIINGRQRVILKSYLLITTDQTATVAETDIVYSSHHHQHDSVLG